MKRIDTSNVMIICTGDRWSHRQPPCSRDMIPFLEHNERLVSWLQPCGKTVQDQIPAIRMSDGEFYCLSLRMMKAIWRHVRLKQGFNNVEKAPFGGMKLRIPVTLLVEKMRTQSRFNVRLFKLLYPFPV